MNNIESIDKLIRALNKKNEESDIEKIKINLNAKISIINNSLNNTGSLNQFAKPVPEKKSLDESINLLLSKLGLKPSNDIKILLSTYIMFSAVEFMKISIKSLGIFLSRIPQESHYSMNENMSVLNYQNTKIESEVVYPLVGCLDFLKTITPQEVFSFYQYMAETPLLGLNHNIGMKIFDYICTLEHDSLYIDLPMKLYHGRNREDKNRPLCKQELFTPPYGIASHGRANMIGIPALYFCNDQSTIIKELRWKNEDNPLDCITFKTMKPLKLFDIRGESELFKFCYFPRNKSSTIAEYIIPNFIADCCRYAKIDGLIYHSVQNESSTNYVIFSPSLEWFEPTEYSSWNGSNWFTTTFN